MMESGQKEREVLGRAADAWLERGIGRRGFLAVLAAAGLGGIGTWYGLSRKRPTQVASTLEDQLGPRSASLPETSQHKFLEEMGKRFHGTTLRVVTENTAPSKATSFLVQKEFEPLTGIKIEWELLPLEQGVPSASVRELVSPFPILFRVPWRDPWGNGIERLCLQRRIA